MTTLYVYGIPNCSSVKKAREWLTDNGLDYVFVDFKKTAPTETQLKEWLESVSLDILLNKRGTTWRNLSAEQQAQADTQAGAIALMLANPSVIKRPVLVQEKTILVGFDAERYQQYFAISK